MKFSKKVMAGAMVFGSLAAGQVGAQEVMVAGTTLGCFFVGAGTCTPTATATSPLGFLTFNGSTFTDMTVGGQTSFGGNPVPAPGANINNFGSLTVGTGAFNYTGANESFILQINFTSPATGSILNTATITGGVNLLAQGGVLLDFANNDFRAVMGGEAFNLSVKLNDLAVDAGQTGAFNGVVRASAIPEPSTYGLMATGLVGIIGFARRRRAV